MISAHRKIAFTHNVLISSLLSSDDVNTCARIENNYNGTTTTHFRPIQLQGRFSTPYVFPSVLLRDLTLLPEDEWSFTNTAFNSNNKNIANLQDQNVNKSAGCCKETHNRSSGKANNKSRTQTNNSKMDNQNNTIMDANTTTTTTYDCQVSVASTDVGNLMSLVLFGRWFERDPRET